MYYKIVIYMLYKSHFKSTENNGGLLSYALHAISNVNMLAIQKNRKKRNKYIIDNNKWIVSFYLSINVM